MAQASFYVNDIKVRRKGEYLVLEARKKCQHGTVFDEIFLTLPGELDTFFAVFEQNDKSLSERFKRFSGDN